MASASSGVNPRYPMPAYPRGWYSVCDSDELAPGEIRTIQALGQEDELAQGGWGVGDRIPLVVGHGHCCGFAQTPFQDGQASQGSVELLEGRGDELGTELDRPPQPLPEVGDPIEEDQLPHVVKEPHGVGLVRVDPESRGQGPGLRGHTDHVGPDRSRQLVEALAWAA